jgi:hypothetical protein
MAEPEFEPGTSWLVFRSSDYQAKRLVGRRIMPMKNSNDTIGNRLVTQCLNQLRHFVPYGLHLDFPKYFLILNLLDKVVHIT